MERLNFNEILDRYLCEGTMKAEDYEECDDYQRYTIQEIKRAFKRLNKYYGKNNL